MRVISFYPDYYDFMFSLDHDQKYTWSRKPMPFDLKVNNHLEKEINLNSIIRSLTDQNIVLNEKAPIRYMSESANTNFNTNLCRLSYFAAEKMRTDAFSYGYVFFCGSIHPFIASRFATNEYGDDKIGQKYEYFYSLADHSAFFDDKNKSKIKELLDRKEKLLSSDGRYTSVRDHVDFEKFKASFESSDAHILYNKLRHPHRLIELKQELNDFFSNKTASTMDLTSIHKRLNSPVFAIVYDKRGCCIVTNPCLKDLCFSKVLPPEQCYTELEMFVSGVLSQGQPVVELDNETRIQKHGFDLKQSFRKTK